MVASKTCPCLPLETVTKCVGVFDLFVGVLNFVAMLFRLKEATENRSLQFNLDFVTEHGFSLAAFPAMNALPLEFAIASLVCYAVEFNMGALLLIGATKKNLSVVYFWIVVTAGIASFTGLFIRLYELVSVYDFARQLKDEEELSSISAHYRHSLRRGGDGMSHQVLRRRNTTTNHNVHGGGTSPEEAHRFNNDIPSYIEILGDKGSSKEEPPPTYEEAMTMTIKWIYGNNAKEQVKSHRSPVPGQLVNNFRA